MKRLLTPCFLKESWLFYYKNIFINPCIIIIASLLILIVPVAASGASCCPGDIDDSKSIDLRDAITALKIVSVANVTTPISQCAAVVDGKIGSAEAIYILQVCADLRPANCTGDVGVWDYTSWDNCLWDQ